MSSTLDGEEANLHAVTEGSLVDSGVAGQDALLALVESTLDVNRSEALPAAREAVVAELGEAALVEAAAVVGNFQRMTRIADGTGIPLDAPVAAMTADLRDELGLNAFASADRTPEAGWLKRRLFKILQPLVLNRLRKQMS